ncbi:DUF4194 domain-containing protein [Pseudomonas sp. TCU-HL1]|uniref:DUF4194 domain-containing protein n=1 Tax=Pseudomonas sp. TCU-HL1 TaxID=1856685 RepID=UPI00083D58E9|nr:DUF4194 domain-containing protein [Pseudomonas sp. TCU-HL1]AOE85876.1 hypothetical protein THL1_3328 [Pseudomonas sp. TCU-HL1]
MENYFDELAAANAPEDAQEDRQEDETTAAGLTSSPADPTEGQAAYTPVQLKECCQELLRVGLLEASSKPNLYRAAVTHTTELNTILEPFDLALRVDDIRGLAFLIVSRQIFTNDEDEWSHPLLRKQRLTLEQSLLLALLRQHYVVYEQEAGIGGGDAKVALEELLPPLRLYLGELGSDQREHSRLRGLLEQLRAHGVVSEVTPHDQVAIRPIIAHLANPENLVSLVQALRAKSNNALESNAVATDETGEAKHDPA